jgi:dUTPase
VVQTEWVQVDDFDLSDRAEGGFGHTGRQ